MTKTMYDLILENIKDRYFQFSLDPGVVIQGPDIMNPKGMGKFESTLSAWAPLQKKFLEVPLNSTILYKEISKEKFEEIKKDYQNNSKNK